MSENKIKDYSEVVWKYLTVPASAIKKTEAKRQLAYTDWGDSQNNHVVLCVPGLTRNGRDFDFLADALQQDFRVICVDLAGRGRSDWLDDPNGYHSPLTYLADMEHVIEHIRSQYQTNIQLYWVGVSLGGLIGIPMAARRRRSVTFRGLVISDIGPFVSAHILTLFAEYVGKAPRFSSLDELTAWMKKTALPHSGLTEAQWQHQAKYSAKNYENGMVGFRYDPDISSGFQPEKWNDIDLWKYWDKLNLPILVIRGERSEILTTELVQKMQQHVPTANVIELAGVGHAPMLMSTEQIRMVSDFLLKTRLRIGQ